ncbi:hypothetical protein [Dankookia rubra]|nr:hypothetical protein [Dankookia rubra]
MQLMSFPGPADTAPPDAAARGILLAAMLSSVLWVGLTLSVWTLC